MEDAAPPDAPPVLQRTRGRAEVAMRVRQDTTRLHRLHQSGAAKVLWPRIDSVVPEAVFLNTAGGLTGGDRLEHAVTLGTDAALVATTQAAERIYRARDGVAAVTLRVVLGDRARLHWLPQETILFDGFGLARRLEVEMTGSARLLALEALVFGRAAMGERVRTGHLSDQWRIRRDGRLVHAEALRATGDFDAALRGPATLAGARALATLVLVAPDAETLRDPLRALLARLEGVTAAASARDGILVLRLRAPAGQALRRALLPVMRVLGRAPPPRLWSL